MTSKELAQKLNGSHYRTTFEAPYIEAAKENGLVMVFGHSDDLVELSGAIDDEISAYGGATIHLNKKGICKKKKSLRKIKAWRENGWRFKTDIPHETFEVIDTEDRQIQCIGIVFNMNDI